MTTRSGPGHGRPDPGLAAIVSERRQLINLAYRLLGSLTEAEDVVQETYARWYAMSGQQQEAIESPGAWLTTVASRIRASQAPATPTAQQSGIVRAFKKAWEAKDIDALIGLLDPDATAIADGGGLAITFLHPIEGGEQIARAWVEIANRAPSNMAFVERTVNGQPGLVAQRDGVTVTVFAFDIEGDRIKHIWAVRNPEKLRPWTTG
jgi:hypothetical protein